MKICPECGSNIWFAQNFERVRDQLASLRERYKKQVAAHAVTKAEAELQSWERDLVVEGMQRKINRQSRTIRRLEEKLRECGQRPYEGETES